MTSRSTSLKTIFLSDVAAKQRGFIIPSAQTVGVLLFLILGVVAAVSLFNSQSVHTARTTTVTVEQGDTLWTLAETFDPKDDPRTVVQEIERLNGLSSTDIQPGQVLVVPEGGK